MIDLEDLDTVVKQVENKIEPPPFHKIAEQAQTQRRNQTLVLSTMAMLFVLIGVGASLTYFRSPDPENLVTASEADSTEILSQTDLEDQTPMIDGSWRIRAWSTAAPEDLAGEGEAAVGVVRFYEGDTQPQMALDVPCKLIVWNIVWSENGFNLDNFVPPDPDADSGGLECQEPIQTLEELSLRQGNQIIIETTTASDGAKTLLLNATDGGWSMELWRPAANSEAPSDSTTTTTVS